MCLVKGRHFNLNSVQNLSELLILVLAVQLEFSLAVILKLRNGLPPFKSLFWYFCFGVQFTVLLFWTRETLTQNNV